MPQPLDQEYEFAEVADDVARLRVATVNLYFLGPPAHAENSDTGWVLVDAGLPQGAAEILRADAIRPRYDGLIPVETLQNACRRRKRRNAVGRREIAGPDQVDRALRDIGAVLR